LGRKPTFRLTGVRQEADLPIAGPLKGTGILPASYWTGTAVRLFSLLLRDRKRTSAGPHTSCQEFSEACIPNLAKLFGRKFSLVI